MSTIEITTKKEVFSGRLILLDPDDNSVVLLRRSMDCKSNPGLMEFPGGKVDPGETIDKGIAREAKEETGFHVLRITQLIETADRIFTDDRNPAYTGHRYRSFGAVAIVIGGELTLSPEHTQAIQIPFSEIETSMRSEEMTEISRLTAAALRPTLDWLVA